MVAFQLKNTLSEFGSVNRGLCKCSINNYLEHIEECENITEKDNQITGNIGIDGKVINLDKDTLISMNCWLFNIDIFPMLAKEVRRVIQQNTLTDECYLPDVVMKQIVQQQKKVTVLETSENWFGLTYQQDCDKVNEKLDVSFYG